MSLYMDSGCTEVQELTPQGCSTCSLLGGETTPHDTEDNSRGFWSSLFNILRHTKVKTWPNANRGYLETVHTQTGALKGRDRCWPAQLAAEQSLTNTHLQAPVYSLLVQGPHTNTNRKLRNKWPDCWHQLTSKDDLISLFQIHYIIWHRSA